MARAAGERASSGRQMNARTKGSEMKMTSKPNPSHQYIDIVSSTGSRILGIAYVSAP